MEPLPYTAKAEPIGEGLRALPLTVGTPTSTSQNVGDDAHIVPQPNTQHSKKKNAPAEAGAFSPKF